LSLFGGRWLRTNRIQTAFGTPIDPEKDIESKVEDCIVVLCVVRVMQIVQISQAKKPVETRQPVVANVERIVKVVADQTDQRESHRSKCQRSGRSTDPKSCPHNRHHRKHVQ